MGITRPPTDRCGIFVLLPGLLLLSGVALAQQAKPDAPQPQMPDSTSPQKKNGGEYGKHHILWVFPNYRTDESSAEFKPLRAKEKLKVAADDSFDPAAFLVAGVFAGTSMLQNQYASFGGGPAGFGKYYGGAFADQAIGNMMTEALFPMALHQDPRYFTKGTGGFFKRTGYAISREVVTRNDKGRNEFNTSEIAGNAVAAGISNAYYPSADRSIPQTMNKWGQQLALDTGFNILKEFWPDMRHRVFGK
ncbi:MAG: hypothetical protein JO041_13955 [Acidobacteria bacterium]|nr:hypothetical protein [Acidobacteriota bacterium]